MNAVQKVRSLHDDRSRYLQKRQFWHRLTGYGRLLLSAEPSIQDICLLIVGVISAIASGAPFPIVGILVGQIFDDFNAATCNETASTEDYQSQVNEKLLVIVYIAIANLVLIYIYIVSWNLFGERLAQRVRERYLKSLLHKEISFFDSLSSGEVASHLNADIETILQGTSQKVGIVINAVSFFVTAYTIAFIKYAPLGGMLTSLTPAFLLMALLGGHYVGKYVGQISGKIASASSIALETLSNIIIVHAFGANSKLEARFEEILIQAKTAGFRKAMVASIQAGLLYFIAYSANALAYWQGSIAIADSLSSGSGGVTVGQIYTVIFVLVDACIILSAVSPFLQVFGAAQSAYEKLEKNMKHKNGVDTSIEGGEALVDFSPCLELRDVSFAYPSRPKTVVLKQVSLRFPAHKHTAIVGLSGSGKSTITNLLMRFYDPTSGEVKVGGKDAKHISIEFLRNSMSLVQQEPCLLDRSILENIALGLISSQKYQHLRSLLKTDALAEVATKIRDTSHPEDVPGEMQPKIKEIIELVEEAAKLADAHNFICRLRHGYGTMVGSKGTLLSGGQKQRISLSRALVKDPSILLLDEATASLDSTSERRIQTALDTAGRGRTTITIAHRLSTIRNADNIIVMQGGQVVEQGSHMELVSRNGAYADLLKLQTANEVHARDEVGDDASTTSSLTLHKIEKDTTPFVEALTKVDSISPTIPKESGDSSKKDPDIDRERSLLFVLRRLGPIFRPNILFGIVAFIAVIVVGSTYSAAAVIFGNTIGALSPCRPVNLIKSDGSFLALMFFTLAIIQFFANVVSWSGFGFVAERVLLKIKVLSFRALVEQDLHWHESANRSPSSLLTVITTDGSAIGGLTGSTIGTILSILINLVAAIVLTHVLAWKIALVCLATVPLILGAGTMKLIVLARFATKHREAFTKSVSIAIEAVDSIRTVAAYGLGDEVLQTYRRSLRAPIKETTRRSLYANLWLALAYGLPTFIYALAYWWGIGLVLAGEYTQVRFFIVLIALLVSAQLWGQLFVLAPDLAKAYSAVKRVVNLLSLGSTDCNNSLRSDEEKDTAVVNEKSAAQIPGGSEVSFHDVNFSYPARPTIPVLKSLSLNIPSGAFAALVGPSGAGKSTIIALLERMYRPSSGQIIIDSTAIASAHVTFRDSIAFVPQDSVLFEGSIAFNVSLGARSNQTVTQAEIEDACRMANIHDTIATLPQGYETPCGSGGTQLSGGQKQRLAIARALVRRPKLLLLDESTSALDAESERAFKDALEVARRETRMTVVAIAHRLNTIRNADVIFMIEDGKVTDRGTHEDLMKRCESYRLNAKYQGF